MYGRRPVRRRVKTHSPLPVNCIDFANFTAMLRSTTRYPWLRMLRHPGQVMAAQFNGPRPGFIVLPAMLGGVLLVQCWADLLNLGVRYVEGQLLAMSLIAGPILGMLLVTFQSGFAHLWGQLFASDQPAARLGTRLRQGQPGWGRLFVATNNTAGVWLVLALLMLLEMMMDEARQFFPGGGHAYFLVLKGLIFFAYLGLNVRLMRYAYPGPRWLPVGLLAITSAFATVFLLAWLAGIPLT